MPGSSTRAGALAGLATRWSGVRWTLREVLPAQARWAIDHHARLPSSHHLLLYSRHLVAFYLGCAACLLLREQFQLSAVISSAVVGLAGTFIPFPESHNPRSLHAIVYAGSFAGMCSPALLAGTHLILFASACGALSYLFLQPRFAGFGGKLGASAFVVSLLLLLLSLLLR